MPITGKTRTFVVGLFEDVKVLKAKIHDKEDTVLSLI